MKVYEMEIKFDATVEMTSMASFLKLMDTSPSLAQMENIPIILTQTIPFVPDEEYLNKICDILVEKYKVNGFKVVKCEFGGYNKFIEKEIELPEDVKDEKE